MDASVELFVLHALRLRGPATEVQVAERFDLDRTSVRSTLEGLFEAGLARQYEGRLAGWMLTAAGREIGEQLLADELRQSGQQHRVDAAYQQFLALNGELLSICTDWQVQLIDGEEVLNDHQDTLRDDAVLLRLERLQRQAEPLVAQLAADLARFEGYSSRLGSAHERIRIGQTEWLAGPRIDSYHTVWFELHEDLLATLGRRRSDERVEYDAAPEIPAELEE